MTEKNGTSVAESSRGVSALLKKDHFKIQDIAYKAKRQAVNNRPYEVFKFKSKSTV